MGNKASKVFTGNGTWTAPAGCRKVTIELKSEDPLLKQNYDTSKFAIDPYGNAYAWGTNTAGALGIGSSTAPTSPTLVLGGLSFTKILSDGNFSVGLANTGKLYAWGRNTNGQMGDGTVVAKSSPIAVLGGLTFQDFFIGMNNSAIVFGLTNQGKLYGWGANSAKGVLGTGDITPRSSPVAVLGGLEFYTVLVDPAGAYVHALSKTGAVYSWGQNTNFQLGVGDAVSRSSPVAVLGSHTFCKLLFASSILGMKESGDLYSWGQGVSAMGVGDINPRSSPVAVLGGLTFDTKKFTNMVGNSHVVALNKSGTAYAWGSNSKGELGVGDTVARSSPVAVVGGLTFHRVFFGTANRSNSFGLTEDGTLYAWGENTAGVLGVGDTVARSSPVAVLGGLKFTTSIYPTGNEVFAYATDGTLYGWGANANRELGIAGDTTDRSSPVALTSSGILFNHHPQRITQTIDVVPGQSYTIKMNQYSVTFGPFALARGFFSTAIINFDQ